MQRIFPEKTNMGNDFCKTIENYYFCFLKLAIREFYRKRFICKKISFVFSDKVSVKIPEA